ncbi:MAG: protein-glutamate O-methyltransferase CheR, partial [Deltaproteobacteria bacterium]|nr:protein-glutamate O-methyltransferase CheR [Deltaproteobacteria bacterium]
SVLNGKDLILSDEEYNSISDLVHRKAGINLADRKKELVRARLVKRIISGEFANFGDYYRCVLQDESGEELVHLLDAISTNLTFFFREPRHFEFLAQIILPELTRKKSKQGHRSLRIWSAACSTGEEPYSIAITIMDHSDYFTKPNLKILATDLSTRALEVSRRGIYSEESVKDIPLITLKKYFKKGQGPQKGRYMIKDFLRQIIVFKRL